MAKIHPTAIIDPKSRLAEGVEVGAYAVIGPHVSIGKDTAVGPHAVIEGHTEIGERCRIFSHACLGSAPQVRKPPSKSRLIIGNDNLIREFVTMNSGMYEDSVTRVGSNNFIMMNAHIAHDCNLGSNITMANVVSLAGHVTIEDFATIGGLTGIHQHVRVGRYSMIGGLAKVVADIPPFSTCDGHPAVYYGINALGLKRAGFSPADRLVIKRALKILLASGKKISTAAEEVRSEFPGHPLASVILEFVSGSKRGIVRTGTSFEEEPAEAV